MSDLNITLTGNEARMIFFAIRNKKTPQAQSVMSKLLEASEKKFMKAQRNADSTKNPN